MANGTQVTVYVDGLDGVTIKLRTCDEISIVGHYVGVDWGTGVSVSPPNMVITTTLLPTPDMVGVWVAEDGRRMHISPDGSLNYDPENIFDAQGWIMANGFLCSETETWSRPGMDELRLWAMRRKGHECK